MNNSDFIQVVQDQMNYCADLLTLKGDEYTPTDVNDTELVEESAGQLTFGFAVDDRLRLFKRAAVLMGTTPKAALMGMLSKHLVSVSDMCMNDTGSPVDKWTEKITDSINYLYLLKALVIEEANNEKH